jgi:hypothetical protein
MYHAQLAFFDYPEVFVLFIPQLQGKCLGTTSKDEARPALFPHNAAKFNRGLT